jgi:hypothetical protein
MGPGARCVVLGSLSAWASLGAACAAGYASKAEAPMSQPGSFAPSEVAQSTAQQVSQSYQLASSATAHKVDAHAAPVRVPAVVYLGYLRLEVKRLIEAIDQITALTQNAGGYIEAMGARHLVVRIPASDFDATMERLAGAGVTLERQVKALDVTAQFTDLEARLAVSSEARARLLSLLEQVKDVQERLRILEEIKRLSEQLEAVESTLSALKNLMDYFTITIDLVPVVETDRAITRRSPFRWVRELEAHRVTLTAGKSDVRLSVPSGFVLFDDDDVFRAQAADTSMLRVAWVPNEPRGDAEFWIAAVRHELDGRDEEIVDVGQQGELRYLTVRNKDTQPRYHLVGVRAVGDRLWVVEAYYPHAAAYEAHHAQVEAALATLEVE